jgi:phage tail-like protein
MKQDEILKLLPAIFQRTAHPGNLLAGLLGVMENLHAPDEQIIDNLEVYFNPHLAPDHFVPFLASWVDLARILVDTPEELAVKAPPPFPSGLGRLRELIANAPLLSKWRGTGYGLKLFLEIATGMRGFEINEIVPGANALPKPFHIRVSALPESEIYRILIERIIQLEKPAHVTYDLVFESPNERTRLTPVAGQPSNPPVSSETPTVMIPVPSLGEGESETRFSRVVPDLQPRLEVVETGRIFPLTKNVTTVGRIDTNGQTPDIDLSDYDLPRLVSRKHARLIRDLESFFVVEEKEVANGSFLNGQALQPNAIVPLNDGDVLAFAQTKLIFRIKE